MDAQQSIELLEATHDFPCPYMFKVIGKAQNGFLARVVAEVRRLTTVDYDPPYRTRATPGGRHISVTLEPEVKSPEQVLAIYAGIKKLAGVVIVM